MNDWTDAKNELRCQLIDKEIDGTLTDVEWDELLGLQCQMVEHRQRVAPLPMDEVTAALREVIEGLAKNEIKRLRAENERLQARW